MEYKVLARKYRPENFAELKGQEVLVTTLTNAIKSGKMHHAYLLTGIRGVGKTTTARIIAKTINCTSLQNIDTLPEPCRACANCVALQEESHTDVLELDAASKTGVNDIREIIDTAKYMPLLAKYKVYIIDEVHMLSTNAFNALLKILEEPPLNVIFIFATTESQKIPLTIVSRCQTFNLNRFQNAQVTEFLQEICTKESIAYDVDALKLIAHYSEGSLRDSLSLLETIAMYGANDGKLTKELVLKTFGVSSIGTKYELLYNMARGDVKNSIDLISALYYKGSDLPSMLEDILDACNSIAKTITIKDYSHSADALEEEITWINKISKQTDVITITSMWHVIFRGLQDLKHSHNVLSTIEIVAIKACHLSSLPSPEQVIKALQSGSVKEVTKATPSAASSNMSFSEAITLFHKNKEMILYHYLKEDVFLVNYEFGKIEAKISDSLPKDFVAQVISNLNQWTGIKWQFVVSTNAAAPQESIKQQERDQIKNEGLVKNVLDIFPEAKITKIMENTNN